MPGSPTYLALLGVVLYVIALGGKNQETQHKKREEENATKFNVTE